MSADSDPAPIDTKLVENFGLFREERPGSDGALDKAESEAVAQLPAFRDGYAFAATVKVVLDEGLAFLVVPGPEGVLMLPPFDPQGGWSVIGASTASLLEGLPVGSSGSLLFGLAADGVESQSVALADGSVVAVPVRRNVYAVHDPART